MYGAPSISIPGMPPTAIVNGDCRVSQTLALGVTTTSLIAAPTFVDFFNADCSYTVGKWAAGSFTPTYNGTVADHPLLGALGTSRKWQQNGAVGGTPGVNAQISFQHRIEGQYLAPFIGRSDTELSFWAQSSRNGLHYVVVNGRVLGGTEWQFVQAYQITTANTWQQIIIPMTFPAANFPQATANGNLVGACVMFPLYAGTNQLCTAAQLSTWVQSAASGGDFIAGPGFQNFDTGATFQYTDLLISFKGAYKRFPRIAFGDQLQQCKRYWFMSFPYGTLPAASSNAANRIAYCAPVGGLVRQSVDVQFPVTMRITPQVTFYNPQSGGGTNWWNRNLASASGAATAGSATGLGADRCIIQNPQVVGDTAGDDIQIHATFDATLVN